MDNVQPILQTIIGPYGALALGAWGLYWITKKNEKLETERSENVKDLVTTIKAQGEQMHTIMKEELKNCHERNTALDAKVYKLASDIIELKQGGVTNGR